MPAEQLVHLIEDDDAMRDSLSFLLGTAGIAVRTYETAVAFLSSAEPGNDGCIVSDVRMPGMSGLELLKELRARKALAPVILMTGHGDIAMAVAAMKVGAYDFFEKPFDDETFLASIKSALGSQTRADTQDGSAEIRARLESLSARERQVLEGLVAGLPNKSIAFDLGISSRTVEVYRANLMTKMQARSLSELVRMSLLLGIGVT